MDINSKLYNCFETPLLLFLGRRPSNHFAGLWDMLSDYCKIKLEINYFKLGNPQIF